MSKVFKLTCFLANSRFGGLLKWKFSQNSGRPEADFQEGFTFWLKCVFTVTIEFRKNILKGYEIWSSVFWCDSILTLALLFFLNRHNSFFQQIRFLNKFNFPEPRTCRVVDCSLSGLPCRLVFNATNIQFEWPNAYVGRRIRGQNNEMSEVTPS